MNEYLAALESHENRAHRYGPLLPGYEHHDIDGMLNGSGERWPSRGALVARYAFAIPNAEAIDAIADLSPLVEMGAGSGYWSMLLLDRGADVIAYDRDRDPRHNREPYGFTHAWTPIRRGTASVLRRHPDRTLFLCWPPFHSPMAEDCLRFWRGRDLAYIGEAPGGCTATDGFFDIVERDFEQVRAVALPRYMGIHDDLTIWRRR